MNTAGFDPVMEGAVPSSSAKYLQKLLTLRGTPLDEHGLAHVLTRAVRAEDNYERNVRMPNLIDDEMTEQDWEEYSREFERRYNEHYNSIKSSSPRPARGLRAKCNFYDDCSEGSYDEGDALEKCYFEEDGIGSLLPTTEELEYYRRALGCDERYNLEQAFHSMCRPHEDTMAAFFLEG